MEEFVTGELKVDPEMVRERSRRLLQELSGAISTDLDVKELVETALRTWSLPELVEHRAALVAEVPVYGRLVAQGERLVAGRADAICYRAGRPHIGFDRKSDVAPDVAARETDVNQLGQYVDVLGADRGAVIYMTSAQVQWIQPSG